MYAVFADFQFCGLYRSKSAAHRLIKEMCALYVNFYPEPEIKEVGEGFTEEAFLAFGWGERVSYWSLSNALEGKYYGRSKYAIMC